MNAERARSQPFSIRNALSQNEMIIITTTIIIIIIIICP